MKERTLVSFAEQLGFQAIHELRWRDPDTGKRLTRPRKLYGVIYEGLDGDYLVVPFGSLSETLGYLWGYAAAMETVGLLRRERLRYRWVKGPVIPLGSRITWCAETANGQVEVHALLAEEPEWRQQNADLVRAADDASVYCKDGRLFALAAKREAALAALRAYYR